jgi:hypothetical protein
VWIYEIPEAMFDHDNTNDGVGECDVIGILTHHSGDVKCIAKINDSPDDILLSGSYDGTVCVYEADEAGDFSLINTLDDVKEDNTTVWSLAVTPYGTRVYAGTGDGDVLVYSVENKTSFELIARIKVSEHPIYSVDCPPPTACHTCLLVTSSRGMCLYREASSSVGGGWSVDCIVEAAHEGDVMEAKYVDDGRGIVSVGEEGNVRVWKYEIG